MQEWTWRLESGLYCGQKCWLAPPNRSKNNHVFFFFLFACFLFLLSCNVHCSHTVLLTECFQPRRLLCPSCLPGREAGRHFQEPKTCCSFFLHQRPQHVPQQHAEIWHPVWVFIYWSCKTCALTAYLRVGLMVDSFFFCISALQDNLKTCPCILNLSFCIYLHSGSMALKCKSSYVHHCFSTAEVHSTKVEVIYIIIGNNVKPWQSWSTVTSLFSILTSLSELKLSITALWKCVCLYHCQWLRATITWSPFLSSLQIFGTVWEKCTFCGFVSVLPPRIMAAKTYLCLFNTSVNIQYNYHTYSWLLWQSKVLVVMEQIH